MAIKRNVLLNPGPATTTDTVKASLMAPDMCHREQDFVDVIEKLRKDLVTIAKGNDKEHVAVLFSGSGTINMDVMLNSLLPEGKKVLIINNGAYSSRAVDIAKFYNLQYIELKLDFSSGVDIKEVRKAFATNQDIALVYTTHHETGSGILNDIRGIGKIAHENGAVFVADTTSSFALVPVNIVDDNVDFILASAQRESQRCQVYHSLLEKEISSRNQKIIPNVLITAICIVSTIILNIMAKCSLRHPFNLSMLPLKVSKNIFLKALKISIDAFFALIMRFTMV